VCALVATGRTFERTFMRHRIAGAAITGLGNPAPELIENTKTTGSKKRDDQIRTCAKECYETFFEGSTERGIDLGGVDAGLHGNAVRIGVEPGYMHWPLKIIEINREKSASALMTGYAWGAWGSGLRMTRTFYHQYKRKGKFVRFVDKWHPILYGNGDASA
jgi:hypothetical protein